MRGTETTHFYRMGLRFVERQDSKTWRYETVNLEQLKAKYGRDLVVALLRCFVWSDRIQSMIQFAYWNLTQIPEQSFAFARNLQTMVWMVSGILFEAREAILDMEKAGIEAKLGAHVESWHKLREMAERWEKDKRLRKVRNHIGFHVDPGVMLNGLELACKSGERRIIFGGDSEKAVATSMRLGLDLLIGGTEMTLKQFEAFLDTFNEHYSNFTTRLQEIMIGLFQQERLFDRF